MNAKQIAASREAAVAKYRAVLAKHAELTAAAGARDPKLAYDLVSLVARSNLIDLNVLRAQLHFERTSNVVVVLCFVVLLLLLCGLPKRFHATQKVVTAGAIEKELLKTNYVYVTKKKKKRKKVEEGKKKKRENGKKKIEARLR